jgi:uncharacterized MAPEG superfamily protein
MAGKDDHPNIRGAAADVLATFRDERVFPVLETMATTDQVGPRQHAFVALGRLADPRGRQILRQGLKDPPTTAAYAAKGLGLHGDPEDFQVVATFFVTHQKNPYVAEMTPEALDRLDRDRAIELFLAKFADLVSYARRNAGRELAKHPRPETRKAMEGHLAAKDEGLRQNAIEVLAWTGDKAAAPALIEHLAGPKEDRVVTAGALGMLKAATAVPELVPLLTDRDGGLRTSVANALGQIGERAAVRPLATALAVEKEGPVKIRAIEALGRIGDARAIATLIPFLADEAFVPQPMDISAIWPYPHNAHVHGIAVWSILTLRDGKEPFETSELTAFRTGKAPARIAADVKAIREWWKKASGDERYRLLD